RMSPRAGAGRSTWNPPRADLWVCHFGCRRTTSPPHVAATSSPTINSAIRIQNPTPRPVRGGGGGRRRSGGPRGRTAPGGATGSADGREPVPAADGRGPASSSGPAAGGTGGGAGAAFPDEAGTRTVVRQLPQRTTRPAASSLTRNPL